MTDDVINTSDYGRLGQATYDSTTAKWYFRRHPQSRPLQLLSQSGDRAQNHAVEENDNLNFRGRKVAAEFAFDIQGRQMNWLRKKYPEAMVGDQIIRTYIKESVVENRPHPLDPAVQHSTSKVFAIRLAPSRPDESSPEANALEANTIEANTLEGNIACPSIAAIVVGLNGTALRLTEVVLRTFGWDTSATGARIKCLELDGRADYWAGGSEPILQLAFSEPLDKDRSGIYLAIRQASRVTLCVPKSIPEEHELGAQGPKPRVAINPISEYDVPLHIGEEILDVDFNPWDQRQCAVLTSSGALYNFARRPKKTLSGKYDLSRPVTSLKFRFYIKDFQSHLHLGLENHVVSYGQVRWLLRSTILVVCDTSKIRLFKYSESNGRLHPMWFSDETLLAAQGIRNFETDMGTRSQLFFLTSSHFHWMQTKLLKSKSSPSVERLMSWAHQRAEVGRPLKLRLLHLDDSFLVFLLSDVDDIVITYECIRSPEGDANFQRLDPYAFGKPQGRGSVHKGNGIIDLCVFPSDYEHNQSADGIGKTYQDWGIKFFRTFTVYDDFNLVTSLYSNKQSIDLYDKEIQVNPPQHRFAAQEVDRFAWRPAQSSGIRGTSERDMFVVTGDKFDKTILKDFAYFHNWQRQWPHIKTITLSWLRHCLSRQADILLTDDMQLIPALTSAVAGKVNRSPPGAHLLADLVNHSQNVDVDELESPLIDLLDDLSQADHAVRFSLSDDYRRFFQFLDVEQVPDTLTALYDNLDNAWPGHVLPDTAASTLHELIQNISLDIYLACTGIALKTIPNIPDQKEENEASTEDQPTTPLPISHVESVLSHPYADPSSLPHPFSTNINFILDHWTLGSDPSTYSFEAATDHAAALQEERELAEDEERMRASRLKAAEDRRKQARQTVRLEQRRREEEEQSRGDRPPTIASSQIVSATQLTEAQGTQTQGGTTQLTQQQTQESQRPPKKKVKRKGGFR